MAPSEPGKNITDLRTQNSVPIPTILETRTTIIPGNNRIMLSDIFHCYGDDAKCEKFYGLDIGSIPGPGDLLTLYKKDVFDILKREQIHFLVEIQGTFPIKITTPYKMLDSETVVSALKTKIQLLRGDSDLDFKVDIINANLSKQVKIPIDNTELVSFPELQSIENLLQIFKTRKEQAKILVKVFADKDFSAVTSAYVKYQVWQRLPVTLRDIAEGDEVTELDVEYEWRPSKAGNFTAAAFSSDNNKDTWVAIHPIPKGQILYLGLLEKPVLVPYRSDVDIVLKSGAIEIKAKAKALKSGSLGDRIWVEMLGKKNRVMAKVIDMGLVEAEM